MERVAGDVPSQLPEIRRLELADLGAALAAGWRDLKRAPQCGVFISAIFVLAGMYVFWELLAAGGGWWIFVVALGFPLVAPFAAVGFYEISRRLEHGEPVSFALVFERILHERNRQVPSMVVFMLLVFMFWVFAAHLVFGLFFGASAMMDISSSFGLLWSPRGIVMLATGSLVGASFAFLVFATTVIGLPLIVDREIDVVSAAIVSWKVVLGNPGPMLAWAVTVSLLLLLGMVPFFLGLFVVLPLLGHATWHLYRRAVVIGEED